MIDWLIANKNILYHYLIINTNNHIIYVILFLKNTQSENIVVT